VVQVTKNIVIPGSKQKPIALDLFYQDGATGLPLVIFCHGFKGFKDWGHFDLLGRMFAESGLVFLKFNFSHNGTTPEDPLNFTDLEAFGNNNYLVELDDLELVINWAHTCEQLSRVIDPKKIFLCGHSRGGGIALLKASEDKRIRKLVTWGSVDNLVNRHKKRTVETWKRENVVYAQNARTGQDMPMYRQFYETMVANRSRLNILKAARKLNIPYLIIHGTKDEAVPSREAKQLHLSAKASELMLIEGGDHTFGIKHPFFGDLPVSARSAISATISFFLAGVQKK
jgi:uncharacterized protein